MNSREQILRKLRTGKRPFSTSLSPEAYLPMSPVESPLRDRFVQEAEALQAIVHLPENAAAALTLLRELAGSKKIISWHDNRFPLAGVQAALAEAGATFCQPDDPTAEIGISGAQAALAATGSLIVQSGAGQARTASLLPPVHVALVSETQLLPHFEAWVARQRQAGLEHFCKASNVVVISGASRTADIAMQLILGMHGPAELQIILIPSPP